MARQQQESPPADASWGFYADGSHTPEDNYHRGVTDAVRAMIRARRAAHVSPAALAASVPDAALAAFPCRERWLAVTDPEWWPTVWAETSAEACVKYALRGAGGPSRPDPGLAWPEGGTGEGSPA